MRASAHWRFALGSYRFTRYRKSKDKAVRLVLPDGVDGDDLSRIAEGMTLARDLINTPANDMGPAELEAAARALAKQHGAKFRSIVGDDLLKQNFPLIHAVGRAADPTRAPRLIELRWGKASDPKVTLVGKGVCFDTGGLDLKPESAMLIMKKDMGGAATVLACAHMIMGAGLKVSLRVLIPAVENSVAGDAFRPLDVYPSRKGLNVEIGNTDAEGRLVLADALALADEETPDLLVDMGTLTGAARVALGPGAAALLHRRRDACGRGRPPRRRRERSALAAAAMAALRPEHRFQGGRREQRRGRRHGRLDHLRAVPQALRVRRQELAAFRHLRLDAFAQTRPARGRRMPGGAGALCAAEAALRPIGEPGVDRHQRQGAAHHHDRRPAPAELVHREPARHAAVARLLAAGLPRAAFRLPRLPRRGPAPRRHRYFRRRRHAARRRRRRAELGQLRHRADRRHRRAARRGAARGLHGRQGARRPDVGGDRDPHDAAGHRQDRRGVAAARPRLQGDRADDRQAGEDRLDLGADPRADADRRALQGPAAVADGPVGRAQPRLPRAGRCRRAARSDRGTGDPSDHRRSEPEDKTGEVGRGVQRRGEGPARQVRGVVPHLLGQPGGAAGGEQESILQGGAALPRPARRRRHHGRGRVQQRHGPRIFRQR